VSSPSPTGAAEARHVQLERVASSEATAWAAWWRCELGRQQRPLAGGWPGTLSEARVRIARRIAADLGPAFLATREELDETARAAWGAARREWNDSCRPESVDFDLDA
jgi:hypothetical protein